MMTMCPMLANYFLLSLALLPLLCPKCPLLKQSNNNNNLSRRSVLFQALFQYPNCQPPSTKTKVLLFTWFNHHQFG
ncbi:hypothetical protein F5148DRAFT_1172810, partial [Russula earlei]